MQHQITSTYTYIKVIKVIKESRIRKDSVLSIFLITFIFLFNEGQNIGLLESPLKRVIEHGRITRGKLKGYLFATWKKVSCCVDFPYVPAFYAALAAIKAACI